MQSEGSSYKVTIFFNSEKPTGLHPLLSGIRYERVNIDGQKFGQLQYFTLNPQPAAIIKIFEPTGATLLGRAGHSCRPALQIHKRLNCLSMFVHEIKPPCDDNEVKIVPICSIEGKAIHLKLFNSQFDYVLQQPNIYEHN